MSMSDRLLHPRNSREEKVVRCRRTQQTDLKLDLRQTVMLAEIADQSPPFVEAHDIGDTTTGHSDPVNQSSSEEFFPLSKDRTAGAASPPSPTTGRLRGLNSL